MNAVARRFAAGLLLLGAATSLGTAIAQTGVKNPAKDYPSLRLPYEERLARWGDLVYGDTPDEGLAMGESVVADATYLHERVWTRALLALNYIDWSTFDRARQLIAESTELVESFQFRMTTNGGEAGRWKLYALARHHEAVCWMAVRLYRHDEAAISCPLAATNAEQAMVLARRLNSDVVNAEETYASLLVRRAYAELNAGRSHATQMSLAHALDLVVKGRMPARTSSFLLRTTANALLQTGDIRQAEALARQSVAVWDAAGASPTYISRLHGRHVLQDVLVSGGRWQEALAEFESADGVSKGNPRAVAATTNLLTRSLTYWHVGRLAELTGRLTAQLSIWNKRLGADHPQTALYEGLLALAAQGHESAAPTLPAEPYRQLRHAAAILLLAQSRDSAELGSGIRAKAARLILERFLAHAPSAPASDAATDAMLSFQIADHLRSSRVQDAIQDAAIRNAAGAAGLGDLVRREQDARNESRALQDFIARQSSERDEARVDAIVGKMRIRIAELEGERTTLRDRIAKAFPAYDELVRPRLPTPADVARQLAADEAFVSVLPTEQGVHLWAVTRGDVAYRFVLTTQAQLAVAVEAIRRSIDFDAGPLPPFASAAAHQLHSELLAPLQHALAGAQHLVVAAGGVLGQVPFSALLTAPWDGDKSEAPWLARQVAVSQVPSASAWLAIKGQALAKRSDEALLAWGDPRFALEIAAPAHMSATRKVLGTRANVVADLEKGKLPTAARYADFPALPETRDELRAIAAALKAQPDRDLLLGDRATRDSVLASSKSGELARKRVIAFATHGLMAGDLPNLNQPALAMAATADAENDPLAPLLKLDDVLGLKMNADWVVLSACNTAAADGRAEEAMSGLARGFFYAGARSLLVTHWAVETESAKLLTTGTFEHHAANPDAGKAESLRQAMLKVMANPKYAHPAFWAPYALVGDGAR